MALTFKKVKNSNKNMSRVLMDGVVVGYVVRTEKWVVRGTRIEWESWRSGKYLGTFETRVEAAAVLS